jgi:hypothetical protein
MYTTPELVALIQQERERTLAAESSRRLAACIATCCSNSIVDCLARALRLTPTSC